MEEPPFQRDRGDLFAYALVVALVVALLIGVMIVLGRATPSCNDGSFKNALGCGKSQCWVPCPNAP